MRLTEDGQMLLDSSNKLPLTEFLASIVNVLLINQEANKFFFSLFRIVLNSMTYCFSV
jgi:hypothetical protein